MLLRSAVTKWHRLTLFSTSQWRVTLGDWVDSRSTPSVRSKGLTELKWKMAFDSNLRLVLTPRLETWRRDWKFESLDLSFAEAKTRYSSDRSPSVVSGIRWRHFDDFTHRLEPRLARSYATTPASRLTKSEWKRRISARNFRHHVSASGNPSFVSESMTSFWISLILDRECRGIVRLKLKILPFMFISFPLLL